MRATANTASLLSDASVYTPFADEDMKGTIFSEGQLMFDGEGAINVTSNYKHGICSDDYVSVQRGTIDILQVTNHGIHAKDYFEMTGGSVNITTDKDASKGIKSNGNITISGGSLHFNCTGNTVITDGDPSYCAAIKSDSAIYIHGGNIHIEHSGKGGKGISADGEMTITSGNIVVSCTGDGDTYTDASNDNDTYNATCMKADGNLNIVNGTLTLSNSGKGGKCIACDATITIGNDTIGPQLSAITSGSAIGSSNTGGGEGGRPGWGGGWGGGFPGGGPGGEQSGSGGKPKAIRADENIDIYNGHIEIQTAAEGGEGIEAKQTLTIYGGTIEGNTYDDVLQGCEAIVINGGNILANATNNDGIDSNGTITLNGGIIVSCGTNTPEEGFDCDNNTFKITGGIIVGIGGATSTPTSSVCTQPVGIYSGRGTQQTTYTICHNESGEHIMSFTVPRSYNSMTMLFSSPLLQKKQFIHPVYRWRSKRRIILSWTHHGSHLPEWYDTKDLHTTIYGDANTITH